MTTLDRDYSPSTWCRRDMTPDEIVEDHVKTTQTGSDKARKELFVRKDIRYGTTDKNVLDLYTAASIVPAGSPMVVYLHGGYWNALSKEQSAFMAPALCTPSGGAVLIAADYVLGSEKQYGPKASMSGMCEEMGNLLRCVSRIARELHCCGIHFIGHSAGAHLVAAMLSLDYPNSKDADIFELVESIWLVSGVYDLEPISRTYVNEPLQLTREEVVNCSPVRRVDQCSRNLSSTHGIGIHIVYAEYDPPVFQQQSLQYHEALRNSMENQPTCCMFIPVPIKVPGRDHFNVIDDLRENYILTTLLQFLRAGAAPSGHHMKSRPEVGDVDPSNLSASDINPLHTVL